MSDLKKLFDAFLEVTEKKKLDPVGREDDDIDNDGDVDSSDSYLKNRRKKIGQAMGKEKKEGYGKMKKEGKIPPQFLKNVKKKDDDDDDDDKDDKKPDFLKKKMKKESNEETPYPHLDKKKREKPGSNLEVVKTPASKLKGGTTTEGKVECPKCEGKGCSHCDDKGYHMKESSMAETLAAVETNRRVMKWTDFKEGVAGYDEVTYKDKKRPQDMEIGQSSVRDVKSDKHTAGATPPEGIMDKESPKSKQFYKDHQKSDRKWEDMEDNSHEDASKAMKAGPGPKYRPNDNKSGDKQIINKPTQKF